MTLLHMQPLYRRGPNWSSRILSAQWPAVHNYGPPLAHDAESAFEHVREFDYRMFALYYLLAESLATFLGYRITQHLLRGKRLCVFTPTVRLWITLTYCALKIRLIDYAFHGTVYLVVSSVLAFCFIVCALLAIVFHFGPLQFVFVNVVARRRGARVRSVERPTLARLLEDIKRFFVKQYFHEHALALITKHPEPLCSLAASDPSAPGVVYISWLFGNSLKMHVASWNEWLTRQSLPALVNAKKPPAAGHDGKLERRYMVFVLRSGLIVDVLLRQATATLIYRLHDEDVYPFELVVRFVDDVARPFFLYAECPKFRAPPTPPQRAAMRLLLHLLNAANGRSVDVPLRSLRCADFVDAGCHLQQSFRRTRPRRSAMSSELELAFG
ncbi:hypothetical protein P43SY_003289 [Pythium insidiosum]|uniref:Transmembrane protein n=1 Tax=Pythium insidiosum TaxID=114742 RepID=A0AAD5LWC9_PYTIN|nr:hypothetical protein P43SY_003289 [Pythium insidiosum]